MPRPLVALVGRPNVGKSTLFNRIVGQRLAIVEDVPGTTRDRLYAAGEWAGHEFDVVDTGGLEGDDAGPLASRVRNQVQVAIDEADVIVFVTDGAAGITAADHDVAELLRRSGKPTVIAVNKAEKQARQFDAAEFWTLGIGEPFPVSALHGIGSGDLLDAIVESLPPITGPEPDDDRLRVAIVGRPNVGKSSILNRLVGHERVVVSEVPGTTRDAIDTTVRFEDEEIVLIDTAGIRRRGRIEPGIERYSVMRAMRAMERADVAVLVLDAEAGITAQDTHIGGALQDAGVGAIIAVNKWDLVEKDSYTAIEAEKELRARLKFLDYAPLVFISALSGQRVVKLLKLAREVDEMRKLRIPTGVLNRLVAEISAKQPMARHGKLLKIRYATQAAVAPPTFVFFVNDATLVHFSYERYIENRLREEFAFPGTPIRLVFRQGGGTDELRG